MDRFGPGARQLWRPSSSGGVLHFTVSIRLVGRSGVKVLPWPSSNTRWVFLHLWDFEGRPCTEIFMAALESDNVARLRKNERYGETEARSPRRAFSGTTVRVSDGNIWRRDRCLTHHFWIRSLKSDGGEASSI